MEKNEEIPVLVADDKTLDKIDKCPECGSTNIINDYDTKERVCGNCGYVIGTEMAQGPEWRSYTQEERQRRERAGPPLKSSSSLDLSTKIQIGPNASYEIRKLSWRQRQEGKDDTEKSLRFALYQIQKIADRLGILPDSQLREDIATIYRKARKAELLKGRTIKCVVAASFYYVFRKKKIPRTLNEIEQATEVPKIYITRTYNMIARTFDTPMPVFDPIVYVSKISEIIGISGKTQGDTIRILKEAKEKRIFSSRGPKGRAAAALYIACLQNKEEVLKGWVRRPVTQQDLANAAEISDVTLRNLYKELKQKLNLVVS